MPEDRSPLSSIWPTAGRFLSRRVFMSGSALVLAALGIGALSGRADAQYGSSSGGMPGAGPGSRAGSARRGTGGGKESKAAAHYQNRPHGAERCGRCTHFRPPNGCEIVQGHRMGPFSK